MGTSLQTLPYLSPDKERYTLLTMGRFAVLCCLIVAVSAFPDPQSQSFRERIRDALLNSDQNPCGAGVSPQTCVCPDGTSFVPGEIRQPCGSSAPTCTCPNGAQFTPDRQNIQNKIR